MIIMRRIFFNLSFDDVHPESSKKGTDCGGDKERGIFKYFVKLWEEYPEVKVTLFVTPNWIDRRNDPFPLNKLKEVFGLNYTDSWKEEPFKLTKHMEWCKWLDSFENFEVAIHGLTHHNSNVRYHSQEFHNLGYDECKKRLVEAERILKESGLKYVRGFRPPGWGVSKGLFSALKDMKYEFVSLVPEACNVGNLSRYKVEKYRGLLNVPQNWDIACDSVEKGVEIAKKYGLLMAKGHISDYYDGERIGNGLNKERFEKIRKVLQKINSDNVSYVKMQDLVR